jgi:hypothetical protein
MYTLLSTNTLKVKLGSTITTTQLSFSATYADVVLSDGSWNGLKTVEGATNSTTLVDIVAAPATTSRYDIKTFTLHNLDTVDQEIDVQFDATSIFKITVKSGYTLFYRDGIIKVVNKYGIEDASSTSTYYTHIFNATTDWGVAAGGFYTITVPIATHVLSPNLTVLMSQEAIAGSYVNVNLEELSFDAAGTVTAKVSEIPDSRFAGRLLIMV